MISLDMWRIIVTRKGWLNLMVVVVLHKVVLVVLILGATEEFS
jgi:hypothetical protein